MNDNGTHTVLHAYSNEKVIGEMKSCVFAEKTYKPIFI
jgi:hypothetical protein